MCVNYEHKYINELPRFENILHDNIVFGFNNDITED